MVVNDSLAQTLSHINNAEKVSKPSIELEPVSKEIKKVLDIMKDHTYVGSYESVPRNGGDRLKLNLLGNINECGVIKPRFSFTKDQADSMEKRHLPAKGFGIVIVSTSKGLMTMTEAKEQGIGGRLIAYCY